MHVYNLILELTRRCNLRCSHCMRGNAQRVDMESTTMWNALKDISYISTLTLTGGEPSLKPELIRELWNILVTRRIEVGSFYVVTNAKSTYKRLEFLEALDKLYEWCTEKGTCELCVSQDQFHNNEHQPNMKYFHGNYVDDYGQVSWVDREYFYPDERKRPITNVIDDGRAHELGYGTTKAKIQEPWEVCESYGDFYVQEGEVYIAANGNVASCCDMSFKRIDDECIGNINNEPLEQIIRRNCEWVGEDESMTGELITGETHEQNKS